MNALRMLLGAICGVVATGPMTAAMVLSHRRLPAQEKYPLPPNEITGELLEKAGVSADSAGLSAATLVAHFAYGGAAGGLYGLIPEHKLREPITSGILVGLVLWGASYFGLLPALKILRPADEHPARRNGLMLGAHFVWGVCLCALHHLLLEDARRATPALHERSMMAQDS